MQLRGQVFQAFLGTSPSSIHLGLSLKCCLRRVSQVLLRGSMCNIEFLSMMNYISGICIDHGPFIYLHASHMVHMCPTTYQYAQPYNLAIMRTRPRLLLNKQKEYQPFVLLLHTHSPYFLSNPSSPTLLLSKIRYSTQCHHQTLVRY